MQAEVELVGQFEIRGPLVERELAVVETRLTGGAERGVLGLGGHIVEDVAAVDRAEIPAPAAGFALEAGAEGVVGDFGLNDREKSVGPNRTHRAVVTGAAEETGAFRVLDAAATKKVELDAVGEGQLAVEPNALFF